MYYLIIWCLAFFLGGGAGGGQLSHQNCFRCKIHSYIFIVWEGSILYDESNRLIFSSVNSFLIIILIDADYHRRIHWTGMATIRTQTIALLPNIWWKAAISLKFLVRQPFQTLSFLVLVLFLFLVFLLMWLNCFSSLLLYSFSTNFTINIQGRHWLASIFVNMLV